MKIEKVLDNLNSLEKNSFFKVIDNIINDSPARADEVEVVLSKIEGHLKDADNQYIAELLSLIEEEFKLYIKEEFKNATSQLDLVIDILVRDGNGMMSRDWFNKLYEKELDKIKSKAEEVKAILLEEKSSDLDESRLRDYTIYRNCVHTAYVNDRENNQDAKITSEEQAIINTLIKNLDLSNQEVKLLNYSVLPFEKQNIDAMIKELKDLGILFYSKKNMRCYVPDELVNLLRKIRGQEVADKHFRKVLRNLKDPKLNLICRKHGLDWRVNRDEKINAILREGLSFSTVLENSIYKSDVSKTDRKNFLNELIEKNLHIDLPNKGKTIEEKIENLIQYFNEQDGEEKIGIAMEGYDKLLQELNAALADISVVIKETFEMEEKEVMKASLMMEYNIKPDDLLYTLSEENLKAFCEERAISSRGNTVNNILESYKDADNLYLENYEYVAHRDLATLKENGIAVKESELGLTFEELTETIFEQMGFDVDRDLKASINTARSKVDLILNLGNNELILVECKTSKDKDYNKFASVSRQIKSYIEQIEKEDYRVIKSLLIAPEFSDDFEKECGLDFDLNLSLITAKSLKKILDGFKECKHKQFPYKLLLRDVTIKEERIVKALSK